MTINLVWADSKSLEKPEAIDSKSCPSGVYLRRFITSSVNEDDQVVYSYKEAFLTNAEYAEYSLLQNIAEHTPVLYEANGHMYKPKWAAEIYEELVNRGEKFAELFPLTIWDATEEPENAVKMSLEDLKALTIFLGQLQEQYFNEYKIAKRIIGEE